MLPNFLIIGAPRSGTTWIARNLLAHPQVFVPKCKEVHYFDRHFDEGVQFYESFFSGADGYAAVGEATPAYLANLEAPHRIFQTLGHIKLIATLRNPADRLFSRYWNAKGKGSISQELSFESFVEERQEVVKEGRYHDHLIRFMQYFDREEMLILLYDDLETDPQSFYARILEFLGVGDQAVAPAVEDRVNASGAKPRNAKSSLVYFAHRLSRGVGWDRIAYFLDRLNRVEAPTMKTETRRRLLEDIYGDQITELEKLLHCQLAGWRMNQSKSMTG